MRFAYERRNEAYRWFRSYGNANWEFDDHGLMAVPIARINDPPIAAKSRLFHWPHGPRPSSHPALSVLGR